MGYKYRAVIKKVVDGDTLEIEIDHELLVWIHGEKVRFME